MSAQRVLVTYASSPVYLSTDHWKQVYAALLCQLPLRTLHWKLSDRSTVQTIQELNVKLVPWDSLRDEQTSQIPQTLLEKPLLNIYFVVCDDTETYRASVKKQIRDWHIPTSQRKNQEWLIVHIVRPEGKTTQGRMFQMKTSVLDKIKADFNADKKDRCVQLAWSMDQENPVAWAELLTKLKEGIISAFETAFLQREEEVRRSEGQRSMPGWNFCTFFILKESLAISLEGMGLYADAYEQYNELEASFFRVLVEKNLSWFGAVISPSAQDDSLSLLDITKKPYRDLILANSISVFDFRVYLLARQCMILSKMGRVVEICRKAVTFLSGFGKRLRELEDSLPPFWIESWIYSSALSVVEATDAWADVSLLSGTATARFNAVKGELCELAQQQLDIIGIKTGHLPERPPFSISLPSPVPKSAGPKRSSHKISRTELLAAISDKEAFYDLYVNITNRTIELYATAGRRKFALKLHGNLAALDIVRNRLPSGYETYKSLPAHYSPHAWTSLESFMRMQALAIHERLEKPHDTEWIQLLLGFLKAYAEGLGQELLMHVEDHKAYISSLLSVLKNAAQNLESDVLYSDHSAISITIADANARLANTQDGALLDVVVRNRLPCDLPLEEVTAVVSSAEGVQFAFSAEASTLAPGVTKMSLFCPSATAGVYGLYLTRLKLSRLTLEWKTVKSAPSTKKANIKDLPPIIRIPKDYHALDVRLRPPPRIELGTPPRIVVSVRTGRNDVSSLSIKLSAPSSIQFEFSGASLENAEEDVSLDHSEDGIVLRGLDKDEEVTISLPHSDASAYHSMKVDIAVEYITNGQPALTRSLRFVRSVATSLPLSTHPEDFFRGSRLFTRFTFMTTSHQHVRIRSTALFSSQNDAQPIKITSCRPQRLNVTTITPTQLGTFLFQMDAVRNPAREPLKLQISYRMLREEVEALIRLSVAHVVNTSPISMPHCEMLVDKLVEALARDANWIRLYEVSGELVVPGDFSDADEELRTALSQVAEILRKPRSSDFGDWRDIIIPVDVPQLHILAAARLRVLANPFSTDSSSGRILPLFAGQPISAIVSVTTSFHWAPQDDAAEDGYTLRYDLADMTGNWLVSGQKKSDFYAKDGSTFIASITLIALHHGELTLPSVSVTALPLKSLQQSKSMGLTGLAPSCVSYQLHGAEKVLVLPRGGRSTFVVDMGHEPTE